jgi:hypothetical protein
VSIVKLKTFDANFTGSPPFRADGTEAYKTTLMCVNSIKSKYQLLNKCKLLFDFVVHQRQHLHCFYIVFDNIPVRLAKFERNFTKRNFILKRSLCPNVTFILKQREYLVSPIQIVLLNANHTSWYSVTNTKC